MTKKFSQPAWWATGAVALTGVLAGIGCGDVKGRQLPETNVRWSGPPPIPGGMLNAAYRANEGLLTGVAPDGTPVLPPRDGADPMMVETLRFYDTLRSPSPDPQSVDYPDP